MASVCRICLTGGNTALYAVKNNPLLTIYKKLTNTKFNSEDSRPRALCCYCYQKLLKCHTFSQMALRSEKIFTHIYDSGLQVTHGYIAEVNLNVKQPLSVKAMQLINIESNVSNSDLPVTVKDEPLPSTGFKQEVTSEPDNMVEVKISLEDCTKRQFIFKEDNNDPENDVDDFIFDNHVDKTRSDDLNMPFSCNNCDKIFHVRSELISHVQKSHSQVKRKQYSSTKKHTKTTIANKSIQNLNNQWTCHECDKKFVSKYVLIRHMTVHTGEKPFSCNLCSKKFARKSNLDVHMRTHATGERIQNLNNQWICHECDRNFVSKYGLIRHMIVHTREKSFTCNLCSRKFARKSSLVVHMRTHSSGKRYACNAFDKTFYFKNRLDLHIMEKHKNIAFAVCPVCDKRISNKRNLGAHMVSHTDDKPFTCHVCGIQVKHKQYLVKHMQIHMGEVFDCNVCGKQFPRKDYLVSHMRIHTGEKPYACNSCEKNFYTKSYLVTHIRTHTGERPYSCNVCDRKFALNAALTKHVRTHTGEKPFACNLCDKRFNQKHALVLHLRKHTGE